MSRHAVAEPTRIRLAFFGGWLLPMFITGFVGGRVLAEWTLALSVASGAVVGVLVATWYALTVSTDRSPSGGDDALLPIAQPDDELGEDGPRREWLIRQLWDVARAYVITAVVMIPVVILVALFMCRTQVLILVGFALVVGHDVTALDLLVSFLAVVVAFYVHDVLVAENLARWMGVHAQLA